MKTYISSTITFRNHGSCSFNDFCYLNERSESCASGFSFNGVSLYPRVFYGLRQSTLIHCSASRRVWGGYGFCRFVLDRDHGYEVLCPFKRRERRFACLVWEKERQNEELGLGFDVDVQEILSLLVEGEGSIKDSEKRYNTRTVGRKSRILAKDRIREESGKFMAKGSKRIEIRKGGFCETEKKFGAVENVGVRRSRDSTIADDDVGYGSRLNGGDDSTATRRKNSRKEDICGRSDLFSSNSKSTCAKDSTERYGYSGRQNSSRTDKHEARKEVSDEYCSTSLLGNYKSNNQLFLTSNQAISKNKNARMVTTSNNRENNTQTNMKSEEIGIRGGKVINEYSTGISSWGGYSSDLSQVYVSGKKHVQKHDNFRSHGDSSTKGETALKKETATGLMNQKARGRTDEMEYNAHVSLATSKSDTEGTSQKQSEALTKTTAKDKVENIISVDRESRGQVDQTDKQVTGKHESLRHGSQLCSVDLKIEVVDRSEKYTARQDYFSETDQLRDSQNGQTDAQSIDTRSSEAIWMPPSSQPVVRGSTESAKQKLRANRDTMEYNAGISLATHESDAKWVCGEQSKTIMKDKGENSALIMTWDRESRELLDKAEQQVIRKRGSWKQDNQLHSVDSEIEVLDEAERYSSQQNYFSKTDQLGESGTGQIVRGSIHNVSDSEPIASTAQEAFIEPARGASGVIYTHEHGKMPVAPYELDNITRSDETSGENPELAKVTDDAMTSAIYSEKTSKKFIGEFVDKLHQELLTTCQLQRASKHTFETEMETTTLISHQSTIDASTVSQDEKSSQHGSSKTICENFHSKESDLRRSSGGFETKGPSDEICDVTGPSSQEPSGTEAPKKGPAQMTSGGCSTEGSSTVGNAITRRSSRSLWSYIVEMIRKGLGARVESNNAKLKLGTRTSSTESGSSESWFSGDEPDDDENVRKEKNGTAKESSPVKKLQDQLYPRQEDTNFEDRKAPVPVEAASTSKGPLEGGPLPKIAPSFVSGTENFGSVGNQEGRLSSLSGVVALGSSLTSFERSSSEPIDSTIDNNKLEISESSKITVLSGGFNMATCEGSSRERLNETVCIQRKEGELKQRKFNRNKQVQKERFEEWEEAFKLESEQRKTDEMFMREALLEAKKAADTWEVPVGAVMVHDGKIIARGFNLVEEQRDSTAHAEMICIREASNFLRTWRLAGTTLYVTLEPCPMCAGAVLQARVDSVVWGAPNKLLGADGSWISLFPSREDKINSSDQSNRTAAPVHPFHPNMTIRRRVLSNECSDVMQQFFQLRRKKKKPESPPTCMPISNYPSKFFTKMHNIFSMIFCL